MNAYLNIFVSRKRYERISDNIRIKRNDKNMTQMSIGNENDMNIRIFKYIRHTLIQMQRHIQKKMKITTARATHWHCVTKQCITTYKKCQWTQTVQPEIQNITHDARNHTVQHNICSNTQCYDIGHMVCNTKSSGTQWLYKTLYIDDKQSKNCISFVLMKTCTAWTRAIQNRRLQYSAVCLLHVIECSAVSKSAVCSMHH